MMKKIFALMLITILLLAGCGSKDNVEQSQLAEPTELEIWSYYETEQQQTALDNLVAGFNENQDEYVAHWQYVPMTEFSNKLSMGYTGNSLPDIVIVDNPDMPYYIKTGLFADITDMEKELRIHEDYYSELLKTVIDNNKLYGVPFNCNNTALFYRKDIFDKEGYEVPDNWDDFYDVATALSDDGQYGFIMSAISGEQGAFQILPWILTNGEDITSLGGDKTVETYKYLYSLIESGAMDQNCINYSQIDVARKFISGDAVMIQNGPWIIPMLEASNIDYGVTYLPQKDGRHSVIGGENFGVIKGKNVDGSKEFIRYCMQDEVLSQFCDTASVIPAKMTLKAKESENMSIFCQQMEDAKLRSSNKSWNGICDNVADGLYEMIAENKTAEEVAANLNPESLN